MWFSLKNFDVHKWKSSNRFLTSNYFSIIFFFQSWTSFLNSIILACLWMQFSSRHSLQSATFSQDLINLWPRPKISLFSLSSPPHLSFPFFPFPSERKLPPGGERDKQNDADYGLHVGGLALSERTRCMRVCDKSTVSDGQVAEWLCLARLAKAVMM